MIDVLRVRMIDVLANLRDGHIDFILLTVSTRLGCSHATTTSKKLMAQSKTEKQSAKLNSDVVIKSS